MHDQETAERAGLLASISHIPGWLPDEDSWQLYLRAKQQAQTALANGAQPTLIEIGSWKGRSTVTLALALRTAGGGLLHAVDPHRRPGFEGNSLEVTAHLEGAGLRDYVRVVRSTSHDARSEFVGPVDLVFIDGDRTFEGRRLDIEDWASLVRPRGTMVINNPSFREVHSALRRTIFVLTSGFGEPILADNLLFVRKADTGSRDESDASRFRRLRFALVTRRVLEPLQPHIPPALRKAGRGAFERTVLSREKAR